MRCEFSSRAKLWLVSCRCSRRTSIILRTEQGLDEIERFADEILHPGLQGAQLVLRMGGDHEYRQIAVGFDLLQSLHHLESVQAGHFQIEQNQIVAVLAVQFAGCARVPR